MTQLIDLSTLTPEQRTAYWAHELYIDGKLITEKMIKRQGQAVYRTDGIPGTTDRLTSPGVQERPSLNAA